MQKSILPCTIEEFEYTFILADVGSNTSTTETSLVLLNWTPPKI